MESVSIPANLNAVAATVKENNQLVNMKVLRLLKPSFLLRDMNSLGDENIPDLGSWKRGIPVNEETNGDFCLTDNLILPLTFGTIFLGQNLCCYACISNMSNFPINDITVKVEFQVQATAAPRSEMLLNEGKAFTLEPQQTFDFIINREIRDLGSHMMVANIIYTNPQGSSEKLSVKKCFRFTVARPMDFKNKFVSLPDGGYFGEFNIQNLTSTTIVLESVRAITSPEYEAEELNPLELLSPLDQMTLRNFVGPGDSRQFIFRIRLAEKSKTGTVMKSNISPGRVEILWRSRMGDVGKVTTSALTRAVPDFRDILISLSKRPAQVRLHEVFSVTVTVFSFCNKLMDFVVKFSNSSEAEKAFLWVGVSGRTIGTLEPGGMVQFPLSVVPCSLGLHLFPRFHLIDKISGQQFDSEDLAEIFIE